MGFYCSVKDSSVAELKNNKIIDEKARIINGPAFSSYNKIKTKIAQDVYKVDLKGEMLYSTKSSSDNQRVAVPNERIFKEVTAVKDKESIVDAYLEPFGDNSVQSYNLTLGKPGDLSKLSTINFLDTVKDKEQYQILANNFYKTFGKTFDSNNKSAEAKENNHLFYKFLAAKGFSGLVIGGSFAKVFDFNVSALNKELSFLSKDTNLKQASLLFDEGNAKTTDDSASAEPTNELERLGVFSPREISVLTNEYSINQIESMLSENQEKAIDSFNKVLYNDLWNNSTFVTKNLTNDFNRICG